MKKVLAVLLVATFAFLSSNAAFAAAEKKQAAPAKSVTMPRQMPRSNFAMVFGTISKIDTTDPANPKLEIAGTVDNKSHVIDVTPWTTVTKATDFSELKPGDTVRAMVRKVEDKEVAINVMFGKIRNPAVPPVSRNPAVPPVKKPEQPKK